MMDTSSPGRRCPEVSITRVTTELWVGQQQYTHMIAPDARLHRVQRHDPHTTFQDAGETAPIDTPLEVYGAVFHIENGKLVVEPKI